MLQEVLIVRENHIMQWMVMAHENACIVINFLESDGVAIERHLVAAGIVVEPKVIEAVASSLTVIRRVADVKHNSWLLAEEFLKDDGHHFEYFGIIGTMLVLAVVYEEMVGSIVHKNGVLVETNSVVYLLMGNKTKG